MTHPLDVANLLVPAMSGVVGALSDRGGTSIPEYDARAQETWILIQSFQPRDAMDLMLVGQFVEFNALLADGTRDLLRGMTEAMKQRARSSLVAIGRVCLGYIDRMEKRGLEPHRTEAVAQATEQAAEPIITAQAAESPAPEARGAEPRAGVPDASGEATSRDSDLAENPAEANSDGVDGEPADAATSWLDQPDQDWVVETPADLLFKANLARVAGLLNQMGRTGAGAAAPQPVEPADAGDHYGSRQHERVLEDAAAGD